MRVLVLARYPTHRTPGQRFRFEQYVAPLRERGIDLELRPLMDDNTADLMYQRGHVRHKVGGVLGGVRKRVRDLGGVGGFDLAFVFREAFPLGPPWVEWGLRRRNLPFVFDFDDSIWLPHASETNRIAAPLRFTEKTARIASWATLVSVGNPYLAEWAGAFNDNVRLVPTTIDTDLYTVQPRPVDAAGLTIGWSGSHSTAEHLRPLMPVLADLQRRRGIRVLAIGAPPFDTQGADVEFVPWTEADELEQLRRIDIGVMPLPDTEWARGKCGLKALQYMALGTPTVMSPVGVNAHIARDGAALLAATPAEWTAALEHLLDDPDARLQLGAAGRQRVEQEYSLRVHVDTYQSVLEEAAAIGGRAR